MVIQRSRVWFCVGGALVSTGSLLYCFISWGVCFADLWYGMVGKQAKKVVSGRLRGFSGVNKNDTRAHVLFGSMCRAWVLKRFELVKILL